MRVVDDEPVSALVAATIVRRLGLEVTTASDGDDAWCHLQASDLDLAISDREEPVLGGLELCRRLRDEGTVGLDAPAKAEAGRVRYTYLILVTAHDNWSHTLAGMEAGADDYLTKPVTGALASGPGRSRQQSARARPARPPHGPAQPSRAPRGPRPPRRAGVSPRLNL